MITGDDVRQRIRTIRKQKKMSARVVSERMGISRPFYTQLEGGKRRLSVEYLIQAAEALGVKPATLLKE